MLSRIQSAALFNLMASPKGQFSQIVLTVPPSLNCVNLIGISKRFFGLGGSTWWEKWHGSNYCQRTSVRAIRNRAYPRFALSNQSAKCAEPRKSQNRFTAASLVFVVFDNRDWAICNSASCLSKYPSMILRLFSQLIQNSDDSSRRLIFVSSFSRRS